MKSDGVATPGENSDRCKRSRPRLLPLLGSLYSGCLPRVQGSMPLPTSAPQGWGGTLPALPSTSLTQREDWVLAALRGCSAWAGHNARSLQPGLAYLRSAEGRGVKTFASGPREVHSKSWSMSRVRASVKVVEVRQNRLSSASRSGERGMTLRGRVASTVVPRWRLLVVRPAFSRYSMYLTATLARVPAPT